MKVKRNPEILMFLQKDGSFGTDLEDYHFVKINQLEFLAFKEDFEDIDFIDDKFAEEFVQRIQSDLNMNGLEGEFIHTFDDLDIKFSIFIERSGIQKQIALYSKERNI